MNMLASLKYLLSNTWCSTWKIGLLGFEWFPGWISPKLGIDSQLKCNLRPSEIFDFTFSYLDNKQPYNELGNVLSQIVLGKAIKPDFNAEEKLSIEKDTREIRIVVSEMAEYLPKEDPDKGKNNFYALLGCGRSPLLWQLAEDWEVQGLIPGLIKLWPLG